jgi:hypothetical protein
VTGGGIDMSFVRVADDTPGGQVNTTPLERSRSHGRRYACLLVEVPSSLRPVCIHHTDGVIFWAMLHIWNAHSRAL